MIEHYQLIKINLNYLTLKSLLVDVKFEIVNEICPDKSICHVDSLEFFQNDNGYGESFCKISVNKIIYFFKCNIELINYYFCV